MVFCEGYRGWFHCYMGRKSLFMPTVVRVDLRTTFGAMYAGPSEDDRLSIRVRFLVWFIDFSTIAEVRVEVHSFYANVASELRKIRRYGLKDVRCVVK